MKRLYAFVKEAQVVQALKSLTQEEYEAEMSLGKWTAGIDVQEAAPLPEIGWEFQGNSLHPTHVTSVVEVATQMEKNDKTLRTVCAIAMTNEQGIARVACKIPYTTRKIAYGDAEFEIRHLGDMVTKIEVSDLERLLAWQIALSIDPNATEPVSDEMIQQMGMIPDVGSFPKYPVLDWYDERDLPTDAPFNEGEIRGGVGMTFQFGPTEINPVGGYGNLPAAMYLIMECQKAEGHRAANIKCQFSIDWGQPNETT